MENLTTIRKNYPSISMRDYFCLHADLFIRAAYRIGHQNNEKLHAINTMIYKISTANDGFDD